MSHETQLTLSELVEMLFKKLREELKYSEHTMRNFRAVCNKLIRYAAGLGEKYMSCELLEAFIHDIYPKSHNYVLRCTDMLISIQEYEKIFYKRVTDKPFPDGLSDVYENFAETMRLTIRENTFKDYRNHHLMYSAKYLAGNGITDISMVTCETVTDFTMTLSKFSGGMAKRIMSLFTRLLKYAYENNYTVKDLSMYCMNARFFRKEKIPPTFTKDEIERTLAVIKRNNADGKRDYAMLLLAARTGLRTCDITDMKLKSLRFDTDTIEISQRKTGKMLVLPLSEEVGIALIDYFKNGRPDVGSEYVFIKHYAPFTHFSASKTSAVVIRYMDLAGIENYENREPGLRAFRHSLASNMLENNTSIYQIKEYLGHEKTDTTMRYIKIDKSSLRQCALEVPPVQKH